MEPASVISTADYVMVSRSVPRAAVDVGRPEPVRVLVVAYDGLMNPSTRLRILQYVPTLASQGFEISTLFVERDHGSRALGRRLDKELVDANVVFVQRVLTKEVVGRLSRSSVPVVFDLDDAVHYLRPSQYARARHPAGPRDHALNLYRRLSRGNRYFSSQKNQLNAMLSLARTVIVGNDWLYTEFSRDHDHLVILPTSVWVERAPVKKHSQSRPVRLGWIGLRGGLPYLEKLRGVLRELDRRYGRAIEFALVTSSPIDLPIRTKFVRWSLEGESDAVLSFDVGLMPLDDDLYSMGKCAFKAVFCMSRGVPVVASPVGANCNLIVHGNNGFLAHREHEWIQVLSTLLEDFQLRARMGRLARATIEEQYSAAAAVKVLSDLLRVSATGARQESVVLSTRDA
jgi:glycosyltransferase involved in cell wall biosynthesis